MNLLKRILVTAAGAAMATGLMAGTASASTTSGGDHFRFGPESFTVFESTFDQAGTVNAYGPVAGHNGTLGMNNAGTVAYFQFSHGTVFVAHTPTPNPVINWRTCTATVTQYGSWRFIFGTGRYRGAFGSGHFTLREIAVFKVKYHRCQAANPKAQPVYFQVSVVGQGVAGLPS